MTIDFQNVTFQYQVGQPVLQDLTFSIKDGDVLLVVGQNGAGKSTLLKLLNGILKPNQGRVEIAGMDTVAHPTSRLAGEVCVTFQNPADQIFAPTVRREVEFAPRNLRRKNIGQLVDESLRLCKLESLSSRHPYDLSGAQRKLLTIASALASGAAFLAFDEPSAGLSQIERPVFEGIYAALQRDQRGLIVVTHDIGLFFGSANRVLVLDKGRQIYFGNPETLLRKRQYLRQAGLKLPVSMRLYRMLEGRRDFRNS